MPPTSHEPVAVGGIAVPGAGPVRRRSHARWALGTAVLGRPAYINIGNRRVLPADRSIAAFRANTFAVLDAAVAAGVDWVDTARSYGRAEEFVGQWWRQRSAGDPGWAQRAPTISSKWGYEYIGDWDPDAPVHEVKNHSLAQFDKQLALTRVTLPRLHLYQVHSLTLESPLFDDEPLLDALARLRDSGTAIGFSTSGPTQADTISRALEVHRGGAALFSAVQSTWNLLETSAAPALAAASRRELTVIVKEALANGRLIAEPPAALREVADRHGSTPDAVALAAVAAQPWVDRVLLGPAGVDQLHANLRAAEVDLEPAEVTLLTGAPEDPATYWGRRARLPWQ